MRIPVPPISKRTLVATTWLILGMGLVSNCFAIADLIPPYSVSPSLNNLNIAYLVRQDKIKISLYVINHEKFPVLCDTEYQNGPDKQSSPQQNVMPEKAVAFGYNYARKTNSAVLLLLKCIKPETDLSNTEFTAPPNADSLHSEPAKEVDARINTVIETDLSLP